MLKEFYNNLKPFHLFLYGTVFTILARASNGEHFVFEITCLLISMLIYGLALVKQFKKK